jgi:hypothetical protein
VAQRRDIVRDLLNVLERNARRFVILEEEQVGQ